MKEELVKKLDYALQEVRRKFFHINYGGCGAFALILADALKKKTKEKIEFVIYGHHSSVK